jgi:hypothetical protein
MNIKNRLRRFIYLVFAIGLMLPLEGIVQAQVNVTDYGAKGDLLTLTNVSVVSNSSTVICPSAAFGSGDVGKLIEIWNAGKFQNVSNETLVAVITAVNSSTSITVSMAPICTATGLTGCYGTDNKPCFKAAMAAAAVPTDTIIIPEGNYLLIETNIDDFWLSGVVVRRGGLTFEGLGNVILTGQGGWRDSTVTTTQGPAPKGRRGTLFAVISPTTNNYPLVWTNLTLYGGVADGWNGGGNNGPSTSDGHGWDISHHAIGWYNNPGPLALPTNCTIASCTLNGWRGEVLIGTTTYQNTFITVSNSFFYDCNASALNLPHAHDINSCTFSNMNFVEEFYRSYTTNASMFRNNHIINMTGPGQIGLNGGYPGNPTYLICSNRYDTTDNSKSFLWTTPATEVVMVSNYINGCSSAVAIGVAGYQDEYNVSNSNITIAFNFFTNCFRGVSIAGAGAYNGSYNILVASNLWDGCGYIGGGRGYATNVVFSQNTLIHQMGGSGLFDPSQIPAGSYLIDSSNSYTPYTVDGSPLGNTNMLGYQYGGLMAAQGYARIYVMQPATNALLPIGTSFVFSNGNSTAPVPVYSTPAVTGAPVVVLAPGEAQMFYWNKIKGGYAWMTNRIIPPSNLRTNL